MDYFDFVTAFEELSRDHMAVEAVRKGESTLDALGRPVTRCDLTPAGRAVLATLEPRIPLPIRSYLAQACSGWQKDIRLKNTLTGSCEPDGNGSYWVVLKQNDGLKDLVELKLNIPDKGMGQQICERWKRNPQMVYLGLLSLLTGEPAMEPGLILPDQAFEPSAAGESNQDSDIGQPEEFPVDPNQQTLF